MRHPDAHVPLDQADDDFVPSDTQVRVVSVPKSVKILLRCIVEVLETESFADRPLGCRIQPLSPDTVNGNNITVAELLDMRSGLYNHTNAPELWTSMDHHPDGVWSPAELLAIAFAYPPNFAPDKAYECSNTNYVLLGLIVEKVGGKPLAQAMQERLHGPPDEGGGSWKLMSQLPNTASFGRSPIVAFAAAGKLFLTSERVLHRDHNF